MQVLQEKVSRLEEAWAQKEKFIQSNRMILKFRDDRIAHLKRELEKGECMEPARQDQVLINQLLQETRLLREQVYFYTHTHTGWFRYILPWNLTYAHLSPCSFRWNVTHA